MSPSRFQPLIPCGQIPECPNDAFQLLMSCAQATARRDAEGGANQVCRDQDGESLIRISGRDSTGTYLRFHTSMRTSARACTSHARPRPRSIRANHAIQRYYSVRAYPSKSACNHTRRTIYSDYFHYYYVYSLFHPRPHARTSAHPHAPIVRRSAQYVPVDHASCCGNNSSSATLSASMLSASHKSICCPVMRGDGVTDRANG